ncbi:sister chromatid cohesion 1 protein 3-like isoform X1 [Zingiber officinale]|uniref:sister chromatid cohesion 1 protein 3-like isoform X1 n=2 Tax=Zingiber officinale TaxID=94328 RepID=UPI001C4C72B7|nr:sister chromatid cohesion 1 protein 3-like isoform X1 [Zingiber officinale]
MFYSHSLLSKKGPLGTIWIAAHCFKKLKKNQIHSTDISSSVDKIIPEIHISHRVLAHLLLGIVRIFSKKVDYLYHDCNAALTCMSISFIPLQVTVKKGATFKPQQYSVRAKRQKRDHVDSSEQQTYEDVVETICASHPHVTINVPERLELDSFDLEIPDDNDLADMQPHQQSKSQADHYLDDHCDPFFQNEFNHGESIMQDDIVSSCFTPVSDALPRDMMDIDLQLVEEYNLSSERLEGEDNQRDIRCHRQLKLDQLPDTILHPLKENTIYTHNVENFENSQKPVEPLVLDMTLLSNDEACPSSIKENAIATHPTKTHNGDPLQCDLEPAGIPSPKFSVRTPAKKEHRMLRKRKILFDEAIVLSNKTLRKGIHDASNLVLKRKKAPHTFLDVWKHDQISTLQLDFSAPLIHCMMASELKTLFQTSSFVCSPLNILGDHDLNPLYPENNINKASEVEQSQHKVVTELPSTGNYTEEPITDKNEIEMQHLGSIESADAGLDFISQELESQEKDAIVQEKGWSLTTRAVARYLYRKLLVSNAEERRRSLSLYQILQRRKRSDSARFFYEILILKGRQVIDVSQDSPDEIIISPTQKLEEEFKS